MSRVSSFASIAIACGVALASASAHAQTTPSPEQAAPQQVAPQAAPVPQQAAPVPPPPQGALQAPPGYGPPPPIAGAPYGAPGTPVAVADPPPPSNMILINPFSLLAGIVDFELERALGSSFSVIFSPAIYAFVGPMNPAPGFDVSGGLLDVALHWFFLGGAPRGGWIGPQVDIAYIEISNDLESASGIGWGVGAQIGYTWILGVGVVVSIGLGAEYLSLEAEESDGTKLGASDLVPNGRLAVGFAF